MTGEANIVVERETAARVDRLRSYRIVIDGATVGRIGPGETRQFATEARQHEVWVKIDWCRSGAVRVVLQPGDCVNLRCSASKSVAGAVLKWLTSPTSYLTLELVDTRRGGETSEV